MTVVACLAWPAALVMAWGGYPAWVQMLCVAAIATVLAFVLEDGQ